MINCATGYDNSNACRDVGAVYVFTRSGSSWASQAYLKPPQANNQDEFGFALALSGDTLAVGARYEDGCGTSVVNGGSGQDTSNSCGNTGAGACGICFSCRK